MDDNAKKTMDEIRKDFNWSLESKSHLSEFSAFQNGGDVKIYFTVGPLPFVVKATKSVAIRMAFELLRAVCDSRVGMEDDILGDGDSDADDEAAQ